MPLQMMMNILLYIAQSERELNDDEYCGRLFDVYCTGVRV